MLICHFSEFKKVALRFYEIVLEFNLFSWRRKIKVREMSILIRDHNLINNIQLHTDPGSIILEKIAELWLIIQISKTEILHLPYVARY